jgi:hypothetical protein
MLCKQIGSCTRSVPAIVAALVALAACASQPQGRAPQQAAATTCGQQPVKPAVPLWGQGAIVGAAGGAGLGAALSHNNRAQGALIGSAAGSLIGGLAGLAAETMQHNKQAKEVDLACRTQTASAVAATYHEAASQAEQEAANLERSMTPLQRSVATGARLNEAQRVKVQQAKATTDRYDAMVKEGYRKVYDLNLTIKEYRTDGLDTSQLEAQRDFLLRSIEQLNGSLSRVNRSIGNLEA